MTGNEYFVRFFHKLSDDCGLPFSFLPECAIQFVRSADTGCERQIRGGVRRAKVHSLIVPGETSALKASN
jgi:hypothetical protein